MIQAKHSVYSPFQVILVLMLPDVLERGQPFPLLQVQLTEWLPASFFQFTVRWNIWTNGSTICSTSNSTSTPVGQRGHTTVTGGKGKQSRSADGTRCCQWARQLVERGSKASASRPWRGQQMMTSGEWSTQGSDGCGGAGRDCGTTEGATVQCRWSYIHVTQQRWLHLVWGGVFL